MVLIVVVDRDVFFICGIFMYMCDAVWTVFSCVRE
jgi:hypothetical protein